MPTATTPRRDSVYTAAAFSGTTASAADWTAIGRTFATFGKRATLALGLGCIMAGAVTAGEDAKTEILTGRWALVAFRGNNEQVVDISRCGTQWCGVAVAEGGKCGRVVMRLDVVNRDNSTDTLITGHYSPAAGVEPYAIGAEITLDKEGTSMTLFGHTGGKFQPFRRSYPLHLVMSRMGGAVCKADEKLS